MLKEKIEIFPGSVITLVENTLDYTSGLGERKIVDKVSPDGKIIFLDGNSELGYWRHPNFVRYVNIECISKDDYSATIKFKYLTGYQIYKLEGVMVQ